MSFPSDLKAVLPQWVREGLLAPTQAEAIARRHDLDMGAPGSGGLLLPAIYLIGACLIGGGAISFVAAHWDTLPVPLRIGLLLVVMSGCEITGYILWRVRGTRARLGQALVVVGAIVFGASIFLVAQMLHMHGPPHTAFAVWAAGALVLAYATMSVWTMALACIVSYSWCMGWVDANPHDAFWYPVALIAACTPFLKQRSVLVFAALLLALAGGLLVCASQDAGQEWGPMMMAVALGALYRALGLWLEGRPDNTELALPARLLGGAVLLVPVFFLSFHLGAERSAVVKNVWTADGWLWTAWLAVVWAAALVTAWSSRGTTHSEGEYSRSSRAMIIGAVLVTAGISAGHHIVLPVTANLALIGVVGALIWDAVEGADRRAFWLGLGLLCLVLMSRFLEWDTHLMIKSAVFVLCGVAVLVGGVRFEKHLQEGRP